MLPNICSTLQLYDWSTAYCYMFSCQNIRQSPLKKGCDYGNNVNVSFIKHLPRSHLPALGEICVSFSWEAIWIRYFTLYSKPIYVRVSFISQCCECLLTTCFDNRPDYSHIFKQVNLILINIIYKKYFQSKE